MTSLLEVRNLRISARRDDGQETAIVKDVSFKVEKSQVVALIGESGSGKTTIALSSHGYTKPGLEVTGGEILLNGTDVLTMSPEEQRDLRGGRVAYLAQSAAATFNPALRIGKQVTESSVLHGKLTQAEADKRAEALYRALDLPDPERLGQRYPHQVSGGQLQRLMAAMALCGKPDLLVLDEPTTALDVTTQIEVLKAFKSVIQEEEAAAIYVTHDLAIVAQVADYIVVLYNGEIQEEGPADQIIERPTHPYTKRLMSAVRPSPAAGDIDAATAAAQSDPVALEAWDITAGYGKGAQGAPLVTVLQDVEIKVKRGHVVGVIGESGCGKSTFARVLAGLLPPFKGAVSVDDRPLPARIADRSRADARKIQFVFQMADTALNPRQKIGDILGRPLQFYLGLKGREKRARIAEILQMVELPPEFAHRYPNELSGGQKQRVNLGRALAAEPEVLLCDEVTSALDSIVGANVINLLRELRRNLGVSFVFISHDLSTVASFSDEIVVLYAGRIVEQGTVAQVLSPPYHPYTRLLITSVPEMRVGWLEASSETREAAAGIAKSIELGASGCPFTNRCPMAIDNVCETEAPPVRELAPGHRIACHLPIEPETKGGASAAPAV